MTYLVDLLLEPLFEHLISLIKDDGFDVREINVASLNVVKHSSTSTHKEVNTSFELSRLVIDADSAIDSQTVEFIWMVLQLLEFVLNLHNAE